MENTTMENTTMEDTWTRFTIDTNSYGIKVIQSAADWRAYVAVAVDIHARGCMPDYNGSALDYLLLTRAAPGDSWFGYMAYCRGETLETWATRNGMDLRAVPRVGDANG